MSVQEKDITLAKQGDASAFEKIYSETIKGAFYVARKYLGSDAAAEDVLQESYVKIYERLDLYQTGNFQGWVDTIVANRCKDYLKKKNPLLFSEMDHVDEDDFVNNVVETKTEFQPDAQVDYNETKRLMLEIIDNLPADQRMSVMMFYYEEMSVKEIAAACECSENTIKSRLNYGRKAIKSEVEALEKKGTKLYSVSIIPFLIWVFQQEAEACTLPATITYATIASNAVATTVAGTVTDAIGSTLGSTIGNTVGSTAGTAAGTAAAAGAKVGLSLVAKIAIGLASVAAVTGIGLGVYAMVDSNKSESENVKDNIETVTFINNESTTIETTTTSTTKSTSTTTTETTADNSNNSTTNSTTSMNGMEGTFHKEGSGDEAQTFQTGGTSITVISYKDGKASFRIEVAAARATKVDEILVENVPVKNGVAEFTFEPTGFGTYGHGTLEFVDENTIVLNKTIDGTNMPNASWRMGDSKDEVYIK